MRLEECVPVTSLRFELAIGHMQECPLCGWTVSGEAIELVRTPHKSLTFHPPCLAQLHGMIGMFWYRGRELEQ